jgi:cytochrome c-type biogenesis protein
MTALVTASPLGVLVAFGAGVLSFLSPCVLPLVPGYVSMVSGLSAAELGPAGAPVPLRRTVRDLCAFVAGFTVVFVALGAAASGLGHVLGSHRSELTTAAGAVVVLLGAVLALGAVPERAWVWMGPRRAVGAAVLGERRFVVAPRALGAFGAPVMGAAFGFAWTPCIGPVLGAVTALAASRGTLAGGVVLLFAYALGLGVPFLGVGLAFGHLTSRYARAGRTARPLLLVAGGVLVLFGVILLTGHLGWLSAQLQQILRHIGLGRLATS